MCLIRLVNVLVFRVSECVSMWKYMLRVKGVDAWVDLFRPRAAFDITVKMPLVFMYILMSFCPIRLYVAHNAISTSVLLVISQHLCC